METSKSGSGFFPDKEDLQHIIQWDVRNWSKVLRFWEKHFAVRPGMKVLALGEREGGLSFYFAKKGCEVVCSDYNEFPETTKTFHTEKGIDSQISYARIDMRQIAFPDNSFDVVTFKSVLGALGNKEDQDQAIAEMKRVLKPAGALLFAENAVGSALHRSLRKRHVNWAHRWRYISRDDVQGWCTGFSKSNFKRYGALAVFGRSEKQRSFLSYIDSVVIPMTPASWRYIYFGVMIK